MDDPFDSCDFVGTAQGIHIVGEGQAVLTETAPFSYGAAKRVELRGAQIAGKAIDVLESPQELTPVAQNDPGVAYDADYEMRAARFVAIRIDGGNVGTYRGTLCNNPRGCAVVFGHGPRVMVLERASDSPVVLTQEFPFGILDGLPPNEQPHVSLVELRGATGVEHCQHSDETFAKADLRFTGSVRRVAEIRLGNGTLTTSVQTDRPPAHVRSLVPLVFVASSAVAGASATVYLAKRRGRGAAPSEPDSEPFDVFLCHNSKDKEEVKRIGEALRARGLRVFLDEWDLPPGKFWRTALEEQIRVLRSAAVFFGGHGVGDWQNLELTALLNQLGKQGRAVIPVFLKSAPRGLELPPFVGGFTHVDFRVAVPDPLERLIWGITATDVELPRAR